MFSKLGAPPIWYIFSAHLQTQAPNFPRDLKHSPVYWNWSKSLQKKGAKNWLVVLTILKNISQWEGLSHILWKIKNVPNHQPEKVHHCWPIYFPQHDAIALPTSSHWDPKTHGHTHGQALGDVGLKDFCAQNAGQMWHVHSEPQIQWQLTRDMGEMGMGMASLYIFYNVVDQCESRNWKTPSTNGLWNNLQKHWDSTEVDAQDDEFCGAPPSAMAMDVVANGATDSHWCWPESGWCASWKNKLYCRITVDGLLVIESGSVVFSDPTHLRTS